MWDQAYLMGNEDAGIKFYYAGIDSLKAQNIIKKMANNGNKFAIYAYVNELAFGKNKNIKLAEVLAKKGLEQGDSEYLERLATLRSLDFDDDNSAIEAAAWLRLYRLNNNGIDYRVSQLEEELESALYDEDTPTIIKHIERISLDNLKRMRVSCSSIPLHFLNSLKMEMLKL